MIENSSEINHEKDQFNILLTGYEGPIDLLLDLAKKQKVDLSEISILALAEQYIEYINNYNKIHLEIAADYLVMSAWLTYLKSRLLLPKDEIEDEYTPEELEEALRFQLLRLEAIQKTSKNLYEKPLINRDTFYGGIEEGVKIKYDITYKAKIISPSIDDHIQCVVNSNNKMGLIGSGGLFCGYVIFLLIGAYIFRELEHPHEVKRHFRAKMFQ